MHFSPPIAAGNDGIVEKSSRAEKNDDTGKFRLRSKFGQRLCWREKHSGRCIARRRDHREPEMLVLAALDHRNEFVDDL